MLTYDSKAETISSKSKTYKLVEIDEELIYQWIKSGDLSMKAFDVWFRAQRAEAFADGFADGAFNINQANDDLERQSYYVQSLPVIEK